MKCVCCSDGVHLTLSGADLVIEAEGKRWTFEWHYYCGPTVLNRHGDPAARQPGQRSPFWRAVTIWKRQGSRVHEGLCVWEEPSPEAWINIGGRNWALVGTDLANRLGRGEPVMRRAAC